MADLGTRGQAADSGADYRPHNHRRRRDQIQVQLQPILFPKYPRFPTQPHGFIEAISMNDAGKSILSLARDIDTLRSSIGCRITSSADRLNSGSSSRNSTPLCASDISPGCGIPPPPTKAASLVKLTYQCYFTE